METGCGIFPTFLNRRSVRVEICNNSATCRSVSSSEAEVLKASFIAVPFFASIPILVQWRVT